MNLELIYALILVILNSLLCLYAIRVSIKSKSNIVIWWVLALYFSIIYLIKLFTFKQHLHGFSNQEIIITDETKLFNILIWFTYNLIFFIGQLLFINKTKSIPTTFLQLYNWKRIYYILLIVLGIIIFPLFKRLSNLNYTDFIEYKGGAWDLIFFQVSIPLVTISIKLKKRFTPFIVMVIGVILAYITSVRSLALMPVLSYIVLYIDEFLHNKSSFNTLKKNTITGVVIISFILIMITSYIRNNEIGLPENALVDINLVLFQNINISEPLGLITYLNYFLGLLRPLLSGIFDFSNLPQSVAEFNSEVFYDYSSLNNLSNYYHMPGLWYNEVLVSAGYFGFAVVFFYSLLLHLLEIFLKKNPIVYTLFLPIFVWNIYFVFRGASDNTLSSISYSFWILLILYIINKNLDRLKQ